MTDLRAEQSTAELDDARYDDVVEFLQANQHWNGPAAEERQAGAGAVVRYEGRLLDVRDYEGWLTLYTPASIYWVPRNEEVGDPRTEPSIHFDDLRRLEDRVALLRSGHLHAQTPPSRTVRVLANVEQRPGTGTSVADIHSSLVVHEYRRSRERHYIGRQFHRLERQVDGAWRIRYRILLLIDRDGPQGNNTFIL